MNSFFKENISRRDLLCASSASLISYLPDAIGAASKTVQSKLYGDMSVKDFGANGGGADESAAANAMLEAHNYLKIPSGFTLVAKNIELRNNSTVIVDGTLKLPSGCADFDKALYATGKTGIVIIINELDGNVIGQSGNIGTHLVYLINCVKPIVNIKYMHGHYVASGAAMPPVDGIRNKSSGCVFLYQATEAKVDIGMISGWGREAVYLLNCNNSEASLGHAQGTGFTEYSGIQVSGRNNKILHASVDNAGASGVGFDTAYGSISNIISTNSRANSGVNFGHLGYPATGSVAENIVVDGAYAYGISVASSTIDLSISNFNVSNSGIGGISFSDNSVRGKIVNGLVSQSGRYNLNASVTVVDVSNVRSEGLDARTVVVKVSSGKFIAGEVVTSSGGATGIIRRALNNLNSTEQILFFVIFSGTFVASQTLNGTTSRAIGVLSLVFTPVQYNEKLGGKFIDPSRNR